MSAKHAPMPWASRQPNGDALDSKGWEAVCAYNYPAFQPIHDADGNVIALVVGRGFVPTAELDRQMDDNARLMAAAPELLEACKVALDQTCSVGRSKDWEQLRAAIAKATGGAV